MLSAGFYLLRYYDMATATYVAVAINICGGAVVWPWRVATPAA